MSNNATLTGTSNGASRLAFRREGPVIKVYVAQPGTMDKAFEVGSVCLAFAQQQGFYDDYVALMAKAHAQLIETSLGVTVIGSSLQDAPQHEIGGHA